MLCRIRWNQWSIDEKVSLKVQVMVLLSGGTLDLLEEEMHIKDAVSRIVVEMIKREWPQQWPSLMEELDVLCTMGVSLSCSHHPLVTHMLMRTLPSSSQLRQSWCC